MKNTLVMSLIATRMKVQKDESKEVTENINWDRADELQKKL